MTGDSCSIPLPWKSTSAANPAVRNQIRILGHQDLAEECFTWERERARLLKGHGLGGYVSRRLRVLVLSYYYPPAGGPAVQRVEKLLRYLPEEVDATVIAATVADYQSPSPLGMPLDATRFHTSKNVCRVPAGCPYRLWQLLPKLRLFGAIQWCYVPDVARRWARTAVRLADELHRAEPFDVIFSTAPPFSVALAGRDCAQRLRIPWVCDLRDLWTGYLRGAWPSRWHHRYEFALEKSVLAQATTTVMVTPGSREWMLRAHSFLSPDRIESVTNGYDASDFSSDAKTAEDRFVIVYTGVFCGPEESGGSFRRFVQGRSFRLRPVDLDTDSPIVLIRAMELLNDPRVEFRHLGPTGGEILRLFATSSVRSQIKASGYHDHRNALAELTRSDAAYLCLTTIIGEPRNEQVPQKTFEYLGSRKPVIAPIQDGDAKDFLVRAETGICTRPDDASALAKALRSLVEAKFSGRPLVFPREDFIQRFEWNRLAEKLFQILDRAASPRHGASAVSETGSLLKAGGLTTDH